MVREGRYSLRRNRMAATKTTPPKAAIRICPIMLVACKPTSPASQAAVQANHSTGRCLTA